MRRITFIILFFITSLLFGQNTLSLNGHVLDENGHGLPAVNIWIENTSIGTQTNQEGFFSLSNINKGKYNLVISFLGYQTQTRTIDLNENTHIDVQLKPDLKSLHEVTITDKSDEENQKHQSLNTEIVDQNYLQMQSGTSLMKSLSRMPGVSTIDIGSGVSKPVIRGLSFNRLVVIENGSIHEGQQWGADHGLEIDQFSTEKVELIKGPSAIMHGPDAIAGVIKLDQSAIPSQHTVGSKINLGYKSNNQWFGGSAMAYTRLEHFFIKFRITKINYADFRVPTESVDLYSYKVNLNKGNVRNTAGKEDDIHLSFGYLKDRFQTKIYFDHVHNKTGFFANASGLEPLNVDVMLHDASRRDVQMPFQDVKHFKLSSITNYRINRLKFELNLSAQQNLRNEWILYTPHDYMPPQVPDDVGFDENLDKSFNKITYAGHLHLDFRLLEQLRITSGIQSDYQNNKIGGRSFLTPAYQQLRSGAFIQANYEINEKQNFNAGVRYDVGLLNTEAYYNWYLSPIVASNDTQWVNKQRAEALHKQFNNWVASLGYSYNTKKTALKINIGKTFRMPIAKELATNGMNNHMFRYEIGNSNLKPEIAYQIDFGFETHQNKWAAGINPFVSYFPNYIYLNPSYYQDNSDDIKFLQPYYYTEAEVLRAGGEIHSHFFPIENLKLGFIAEYIYAVQISGTKKGFTLPFSPPTNFILNLCYQLPNWKWIGQSKFNIDYKIVMTQNQIVPPEQVTNGYQRIDISWFKQFDFKKQTMSLGIIIRNLLNTKYYEHTSYYRMINLPDPGRNINIQLQIPFSKSIKK
ncbi:MAG: TonB-dependent receptor [Bacteroidales bacterium]|nr:TonB-dependent receptor [Bacteroidales bacterium]